MIPLVITINIEQTPWEDLRPPVGGPQPDPPSIIQRIGVLPRGMESGAPSVAIVIVTPDGKKIIAETSLKLLRAAMRTFNAVYQESDQPSN